MTRQVIALLLAAAYQIVALLFPDIPLSSDDAVEFVLWVLAVLGLIEAGTMAMVRMGIRRYNSNGSTEAAG